MLKKISFFSLLFPVLSSAHIYNCNGSGYNIVVYGRPVEMKFVGNGMNKVINNVKVATSFDTTYSGNIPGEAISLKLTIKDSSFGAPGDLFKGVLLISSSQGIKEHSDLECVRGND